LGEERDGNVPEAFAGARWLSKPVSTRQLLETVGDIVPARAPARPCALAGAGAHLVAL
jgi:hypothetical protein